MQKFRPVLVLLVVLVLAWSWLDGLRAPESAGTPTLIARGGPFPR